MAPQRAAREFIATFFDDADRASRPSGGTHESVSAIAREDIVDFHRRFVGPRGMTVVVAGDLSGLDVAALAGESLGQWVHDGQEVAEGADAPAARAADATRIVLVDRPGSVQSELSVGCAGPDRRVDGGWSPYPVLAFVLGGSPNARVDAVLREEKGFTYGIRSGFRPRRRGGLFLTNGSVRADSTVESVRLLLDILESGREGFSESEVRAGVDFISKTAPGRFATADAVADEAAGLALEGLTTAFTTENLAGHAGPRQRRSRHRLHAVGRQAVDRRRGRGRQPVCRPAQGAGQGRRDGRPQLTLTPSRVRRSLPVRCRCARAPRRAAGRWWRARCRPRDRACPPGR